MKHLHFHDTLDALVNRKSALQEMKPDLVLMFAASDHFRNAEKVSKLSDMVGQLPSVGCSTSGEIGRAGVTDEKLSLLAIKFADSSVKIVEAPLAEAAASQAAGASIAEQLPKENLKAVFVLSPGVNVNGSELVNGLRDKLPQDVLITGGLAGDDIRFAQTHLWLNGKVMTQNAIAVGFYGENLFIGAGSQGGWSKFGPRRKVTRSTGSILQELDNAPALRLYEQYLGDKAADLPSSGLLYPFAILNEDNAETGLIRTILNVDKEAGSLILAGDLPQGNQVCLMHADTDSLAEGAGNAAAQAAGEMQGKGGVALLVSCVGRKLIMGDEVEDEIDAVKDKLGDNTALAGFYSYGEICPFSETGHAELHNQTMTVTYIHERAA